MTALIRLDDPETTVALRRSARARRLTLTVPQNGDPPRLTAPHGASASEIRMFLLRQSDWLRAALARAPHPVRIADGAVLPIAGRPVRLYFASGRRRAPHLADDRLIVQGPGAPAPRVAAWLKERARAALSPTVVECAAAIGARPGRISLRDQKRRWGSCSARGDLNFSWRLAMAPHETLDYVAAHEAAHLVEMNHGPRFWALVERLRPGWRRQRDWLKTEGAALHRYRFD